MKKENEKNIDNPPGQGRIDNTSSARNEDRPLKERDISDIDRQEGKMEHGELGGNFNQLKEKDGK
jgi:hypothetical protein